MNTAEITTQANNTARIKLSDLPAGSLVVFDGKPGEPHIVVNLGHSTDLLSLTTGYRVGVNNPSYEIPVRNVLQKGATVLLTVGDRA